MSGNSSASDSVMQLTALDNIMVRGIVRFLLGFKIDNNTRSETIRVLQTGLSNLGEQIPFLSGKVGSKKNSRNELELRYRLGESLTLKVNDLSSKLPCYAALEAQGLPLSALPSDQLSPCPDRMNPSEPQPALAVQANIINGGMILCVCAHHNLVDGVGFGLLMEALSMHCKAVSTESPNLPARFDDVSFESTTRKSLFQAIPVQETFMAGNYEYPEYHAKDPLSEPSVDAAPPPTSTARLFVFSANKLSVLKDIVGKNLPCGAFISTSDALGALLWKSVSTARYQTGKLSLNQSSSLAIPIDTRKHLESIVPHTYVGNAVISSLASSVVESIIDTPTSNSHVTTAPTLTTLALSIRAAIEKVDARYTLGLIKNATEFEGDLNTMKPKVVCYHGPDINYTSWCAFPMYDLDFGKELGRVEHFRCPWRAIDGCTKLLPKRRDGGLELIVELEVGSMAALLADEEWMVWVEDVVN